IAILSQACTREWTCARTSRTRCGASRNGAAKPRFICFSLCGFPVLGLACMAPEMSARHGFSNGRGAWLRLGKIHFSANSLYLKKLPSSTSLRKGRKDCLTGYHLLQERLPFQSMAVSEFLLPHVVTTPLKPTDGLNGRPPTKTKQIESAPFHGKRSKRRQT